ncbi:MAG: RuBisCO large subunit C-terminal-like domain-containing protein [Erysipelotrichaceae bacterium]|nr:RuBisCO large subunit C-terminal-like domain-containing protein [Erysipelotrichaceae bacterium]
MDEKGFMLPETAHKKDVVVATYYIELPVEVDIIKKAESLAVGQTIGTWVPIPGITEEIREKYMGKVVNIFEVPPTELSVYEGEKMAYLIQIAYPTANFGSDFPLMITSLLGNDASTSAQVKLMDIEFSDAFLSRFKGPRYGVEGVQKLFGVKERPLLLNMVKPCTGISPEAGANIFYEAALGGVDIIKDDELFGNPVYSKPEDRVKAYKAAARKAAEKTGKETKYFVNITGGVSELKKNIRKVEEAGADGLMVNFAVLGYSTLKYIAENTRLPILGHSAGAGMVTEGPLNGMATPLAVGKLARIAGADIVMMNTPYGGYPLRKQKYLQIIQQLTLPLGKIKATMPSIGGGVHPGIVKRYINEAGKNIVLAAGGSIQGHPLGTTAGAKAMQQAIDLALQDVDFCEAAKAYPELSASLDKWGYVK